MSEQIHDKKQMIAELTKSAHGDLSAYLKVGRQAALEDPDFFAHLVAWNHQKGQIRDAKIALPVIALAAQRDRAYQVGQVSWDDTLAQNALAHLADLRPKELGRVLLSTSRLDKTNPKKPVSVLVPPFALTAQAPKRVMRRLLTRYLRDLEADRHHFERVAVQHGHTLHELYAHGHINRPAWVGEVLFHGEKGRLHPDAPKVLPGGIFAIIRALHLMDIVEAAGSIVKYRIPFLIARGALGKKASEPDTVLALIKAMSPSELVTNMGWLEKLGVKTNPALRAALDAALGKAASSKTAKVTLKTTQAATALADDEVLSTKLHALQEKQIEQMETVEGDWAVFIDKSGSMEKSIEVGRNIAAFLAKSVKGKVYGVFFDGDPRFVDFTGMTLEAIQKVTNGVTAGGGTDMSVPMRYLYERRLKVDGIAWVGDGANHGYEVTTAYKRYCQVLDIEPVMYFYQLSGEPDNFSSECKRNDVDLQVFDLRGQQIDYYALPNLAQTMRIKRFSLVDEVLATPLRTLDEVLDKTIGMPVLPRQVAVQV